jgi:hypothetical protein
LKRYSLLRIGSLAMLLAVLFTSCVDIPDFQEIDLIQSDAEYAVPLINSKLTLESVFSDYVDNSNISYDESGTTILLYSSDIIQKNANEIFKTILFPGPIPFSDTVMNMRFDQEANYIVEKGTFRGDSIRFGCTSNFDEVLTVEVGIKQAELNGEAFKYKFSLQPGQSLVTPLYSLRGYDFTTPENQISFYYDARLPNGERVVLNDAFYEFTYLVFDFLQGYLGKNIQNLNQQNIDVNIFDLWESGLLEFENPMIKVRLDNSFGFPVKAIINDFSITNLEGEVINLESELFDQDIIFEYPGLDEIGQVKSSTFVFDKDNSNFATAFNQKIIQVSYDIDALANPDDDESLIGFYTFDSFYKLNVAVELPMRFKADQFQLADEFEINSIPEELDLVESMELKSYIINYFPLDVYTQIYFTNDEGTVLDSLFEEGEQYFPAATIESDGSISPAPAGTTPFYITYNDQRKEIFNSATHISARLRFSTSDSEEEWTTITKDQGLELKIGLKFKLK